MKTLLKIILFSLIGISAFAFLMFAMTPEETKEKWAKETTAQERAEVIEKATDSEVEDKKKTGLVFTIPESTTQEAKTLIETKWSSVKEVCPGLDKYAPSLKFDGVSDNFDYAPEHAQRATIKFIISENDSLIPNKYAAWGHNCFYEILRDGSQVMIPKQACQSICLDKVSKNKGDLKLKLMESPNKEHGSLAQKFCYSLQAAMICNDLQMRLDTEDKIESFIGEKIRGPKSRYSDNCMKGLNQAFKDEKKGLCDKAWEKYGCSGTDIPKLIQESPFGKPNGMLCEYN